MYWSYSASMFLSYFPLLYFLIRFSDASAIIPGTLSHSKDFILHKAQPQPNVNWIQVTGIDGARNQIVQPGTTAWMMDNNAPYFYVKSVDGVGSVTFKAFEFHEVQANNPQPVVENMDAKYVTREEFNKLLDTLKPQPEEQKGELTHE